MVWVKILLVNLLVFVGLFMAAEGLVRIAYPEFASAVSYDIDAYSRIRQRQMQHHGFQRPDERMLPVRMPTRGEVNAYTSPNVTQGQKQIGIIGDSVAYGYGLAYEDVFWVRAQRMLDLLYDTPPIIESMGNIAANYQDTMERLSYAIDGKKEGQFDTIIYQFNFNDVTPFRKTDIKELKNESNRVVNISLVQLYKNTVQWWHQHMFPSAFLRAVQHVGGKLNRKRSGTCAERGFAALNQYSWTYGSKAIEADSAKVWADFEEFIVKMKALSKKNGADLAIFISPLMYHMDAENYYPFYKHLSLDFACATIEPVKKIEAIAEKLDIDVINPIPHVQKGFQARVAEGNPSPFTFVGDDNHPNAIASGYLAEALAAYLIKEHD